MMSVLMSFRREILVGLLLAGATPAVCWQVMDHDFVNLRLFVALKGGFFKKLLYHAGSARVG